VTTGPATWPGRPRCLPRKGEGCGRGTVNKAPGDFVRPHSLSPERGRLVFLAPRARLH
jgi:hypothetical protein